MTQFNNFLVYDIEIIRAIPPSRGGTRWPGIEYCEGWHDHANMGISVIGAYSSWDERYRVFCRDNFASFDEVCNQADLLVGFNNVQFDDAVIRANLPRISSTPRYDLLIEAWAAAGLGPRFEYPSHAGYGLDAICQANGIGSKSGNGAMAPVLWQQGKHGEVIDYCLNDVILTRKLFEHILHGKAIASPVEDRMLTLRPPS